MIKTEINPLNITGLKSPVDRIGAEQVKGICINKVISKINEILSFYGIESFSDSLNSVKITNYNYNASLAASPIYFEDLKIVINTINSIIYMEELTILPLDFSVIKDKNYRSSNDTVIARGLHLLEIVEKLNLLISVYNSVYIPRSSPGSEYWVRPLGQVYGTGDGSSYDNAFTGFGGIDNLQPGDILHVRGTHTEYFLCGSLVGLGTDDNYVTIDFGDDNATDYGIIDGQDTVVSGINCNGRYNIAFNYPRVTNVTTDGCQCYGTAYNMLFRYGNFSNSGNQGTQLEDSAKATFFKCTSHGNVDDGFSQHDTSEGEYYSCVGYDNDQGINITNSAIAKIFRCNYYSNTSYDIYGNIASTFNNYLSSYEKPVFLTGSSVFNDYS